MSATDDSQANRDELPFVAPCRTLGARAPLGWLRRGFADLVHAPRQSLAYGLAAAVLIAAVSIVAWIRGGQWILYAMLGGFVFLAPLTCVGLYAISAQLERGQRPLLALSLRAAFRRHLGNELVFALVLLVIFLVWARAAVMITVFMPDIPHPGLADLWPYLTFGSMVGAVFAAVTFAASAFSLPMLVHRDVDSITAIVTSINAVLRNKAAMLVWLGLILGGLVLGVVTAFVGLIVVIPLTGYAAWHGYLETIDASAFPRHGVGITAVPRSVR